jgi:hypothetical protein
MWKPLTPSMQNKKSLSLGLYYCDIVTLVLRSELGGSSTVASETVIVTACLKNRPLYIGLGANVR